MNWIIVGILVLGVYLYFRFRPKKIDLSMLPEQFVVFDLETTGLNNKRDEIIEIGAVKVNRDSDNHTTFQTLIKPSKKVPKRITQITGITQEMVDTDGEILENALSEFLDFIGDLRLVIFNAPFDMGFLNQALKNQNKEIKNPVSCALKMSRRAWPGLSSYKLGDLAKIGGISSEGSHRALKDCEMTMQIYTAAAAELGSTS